ncbi:hypothetical protein RJ641_002300 [Dillenia turbinata]|uniref:Protein SCAR n=1 Tax=Dillenia turbinata TaxID=194707 RepID=A0AAN8VMM8_9MAGN
MPLVRFQVRNEYGLGAAELYREANKEDPKAVLDVVTVAGLVGILRQLGDLAEFAGEVFHGLQEQVAVTASRSQKLLARVQHIESAFPSLEKAVLAQQSHLHFAYTSGSDWHVSLKNEKNHFIYADLPHFIMDTYEECRDPPRLHLLDKFDTGVPGSCLKRYSDPTFFKRASPTSDIVNAEKLKSNRRARKSKKKRSSQKNGIALRHTSLSSLSGRMLFDCPNPHGQTSPTHTFSSFDTTTKLDMEERSISHDSRTGSGYIECVFHEGSSLQPQRQRQEPKEMSLSGLHMQRSDSVASVSPAEQPGVTDEILPQSSLQEQTATSSSFIMWDEKTEIVESMGQYQDKETEIVKPFPMYRYQPNETATLEPDQYQAKDDALEMLNSNPDQDNEEAEVVNVDQMNTLSDSRNHLNPTYARDQIDEIESETENYVDALNTIESESESDFDWQTKREVVSHSSSLDLRNEAAKVQAEEVTANISEFEPHTTSFDSTNKISVDLPDTTPPEIQSPRGIHQSVNASSNADGSGGVHLHESAKACHGLELESVSTELPSSTCRVYNLDSPTADAMVGNSGNSQETPAELSSTQKMTLWTNGGLLGLEPSKPPDPSVLNTVGQDSFPSKRTETFSDSVHMAMPKVDGMLKILDLSSKSYENMENDLSALGNPKEDDSSLKIDANGHILKQISLVSPRVQDPVTSNIKATSTEAIEENHGSSSAIFPLGSMLNGLRRKASLNDEKTKDANYLEAGAFASNRTFSERNFVEAFGLESQVNSGCPSPPLCHMNLSFHPVDGFEVSELKLKFSDGSNCHDGARDTFPSFQLVPKPGTSMHGLSSESDDDTFCRSSPYMSDDGLSRHSGSISDQWESEGSPRSKDHNLYDSVCRISSTESISSSHELDGIINGRTSTSHIVEGSYTENGEHHPQNGLPDLASLNLVNFSEQKKAKCSPDQENLHRSENLKESTPLPPPLPPLKWQVTRSNELLENKQDAVFGAPSHILNLKHLEAKISVEPKPAPELELETKEGKDFPSKSKMMSQDLPNIDGQKQANHATEVRGADQSNDFLHQIRTKSFSLRRTVTAKPTNTSDAPHNMKVTAILEKANSIRQAVGSDNGEDDNWSDT